MSQEIMTEVSGPQLIAALEDHRAAFWGFITHGEKAIVHDQSDLMYYSSGWIGLSSALDVDTEGQLWRRLRQRPESATCLVVATRRAVLRQADHVLVLREGRVEAQGSLDDLLETSEEMQRLWRADSAGSG